MALNAMLGWPNRLDEGALSGAGWTTALPLTNLQDRQPTRVARSTGAIATLQLDLGAVRTIRALALINHNLGRGNTWRVRAGSMAGASDLYDSGDIAAWSMQFDEHLEWGAGNWWEGSLDDAYTGHPFMTHLVFGADVPARYWTVDIDNSVDGPGYVQIGRVFIGATLQPADNMSYGMSYGWEDESTVDTTAGGSEFFSPQRPFRVVRFSLDWLTRAEAALHYEMQRRLGSVGEVLWLPWPDDPAECQREGFLGRIRRLQPIEHPYCNIRSVAYELKELL